MFIVDVVVVVGDGRERRRIKETAQNRIKKY
jgi:hypothetical protein